jgi:hypothetical protein
MGLPLPHERNPSCPHYNYTRIGAMAAGTLPCERSGRSNLPRARPLASRRPRSPRQAAGRRGTANCRCWALVLASRFSPRKKWGSRIRRQTRVRVEGAVRSIHVRSGKTAAYRYAVSISGLPVEGEDSGSGNVTEIRLASRRR